MKTNPFGKYDSKMNNDLWRELDAMKKAEDGESADLWKILRNACSRISLSLRDCMRREEGMNPSASNRRDYNYLQLIRRFIASEDRAFLLKNRYRMVASFVRTLAGRMNREETAFQAGGNVLL